MRRAIEARVFKLEAKRRQRTGLFFLAWGRNENEAVAVVDGLKADGSLDDSDVPVAGTWTHVDSMPTSRWIRNGGLSRQEHNVLVDEVARVYEHFLARTSAQTLKKLDEACKEHGIVARSLSDEELIAEMWRGTKQGLLIENFRWLEEVAAAEPGIGDEAVAITSGALGEAMSDARRSEGIGSTDGKAKR